MHPTNNDTFVLNALEPVARRYESLLDLIADISDEDPFVALRLLHVYGVNMFSHILSADPPGILPVL